MSGLNWRGVTLTAVLAVALAVLSAITPNVGSGLVAVALVGAGFCVVAAVASARRLVGRRR